MELLTDHYASPRWSYEILDCAMPMTFDTYSNCAHQCVYCFSFFQRAIHPQVSDAYLAHKVKAVDVERVKRLFRLDPSVANSRGLSQFVWYVKNRHVLQWGGLSDGFDWYERKFRKSLELLKFFCEIDYPVSISTKGTWFLDDPEYTAVLRGAKNVHIKYSIITADADHARKLEAGTPSPDERFKALEKLNALGIGATTLRFRPYIIGTSDKSAEELFRRARDAGAYSVSTEFLCIEKRANAHALERYQRISDVVGYDVWQFYRQNSYSGSGLMRLNYDIKRPYMQQMEELSATYNLPLFVSDAHHKEKSAAAGCCGLPETGPLSNYNKGQFAEAMQIAKNSGQVRWSDIAPLADGLKNIPFYAAENFNQGDTRTRAVHRYHSMFDYMHDAWNSPKSWSSPARYFGGALVPAGLDDAGDVIYVYNKPFIESGYRVESTDELLKIMDIQLARKADGADLGHVAYPVFVLGQGATCDLLEASRLVYEVTDQPAARADEEDYIAYWVLQPNLLNFPDYPNARAALSAVEGNLADSVFGAELIWRVEGI